MSPVSKSDWICVQTVDVEEWEWLSCKLSSNALLETAAKSGDPATLGQGIVVESMAKDGSMSPYG